jgi:hypothetical protein
MVALALILSVIALPAAVSAHVLKIDGDIGAVLHINPDDNPVSGRPTDYILYFEDYTGRFDLSVCRCQVSVVKDGRTLATSSLAKAAGLTSENKFTFPQPGVYDLKVSGQPERTGAFQPFALDYPVRVTGGQADTQPFPVLLGIGMGLSIALILLAAYAMEYA